MIYYISYIFIYILYICFEVLVTINQYEVDLLLLGATWCGSEAMLTQNSQVVAALLRLRAPPDQRPDLDLGRCDGLRTSSSGMNALTMAVMQGDLDII